MALAIADYRTRVLDLLDDVTSLRFTDQQIDADIWQALLHFDRARPLVRTYNLDATGYQVLTLPADFDASTITRVQLYSLTSVQAFLDVYFKAMRIDEQWVIETTLGTYAVGQILVVTYVGRHTIDGLDGGAGTTIDSDDLLVLGSAGFAAQSRAVSRSESINMQPGVQAQLAESAKTYLGLFLNGLRRDGGPVMQAFV
jgi:hypothetical protein